jgi:hypothetical protein
MVLDQQLAEREAGVCDLRARLRLACYRQALAEQLLGRRDVSPLTCTLPATSANSAARAFDGIFC